MNKIVLGIVTIVTALYVVGCDSIPSRPTPGTIIGLYQNSNVKVQEDMVTGNLVYQDNDRGHIVVIRADQLTSVQIERLEQYGYKPVR